MINDFISVYDNSFTSDECEEYINLIEHYISNGLVTKEKKVLQPMLFHCLFQIYLK